VKTLTIDTHDLTATETDPATHLEPLALPGLAALPFDATGLTDAVDAETALLALPRLRRVGAAVRWLHGDLVLALIDGDLGRLWEAFQEIGDLDLDDRPSLMRSIYVAHAVPRHRRRPALSWSHHQAVAGLEPDEQERWLLQAEASGFTVNALEKAIAADLADDEGEPLFPPPPKPWHARHAAVLAAIDEAFAADPAAAVIVRADGTWRLVTEA